MIKIWIVTGAVTIASMAGELQAASLAECAVVEDDRERLACFDEATRATPTPPEPATSGSPAATAAQPAVQQTAPAAVPVPAASPSATSTPAASSPAATSAPAAAAAAPQVAVSQPVVSDPASTDHDELFGLENEIIRKGKQQVQSRVMNEFEGWDEDTVFELENGQTWIQSDNNATFSYRGKENPVVTIRKGYFGSFRLKVEGFNQNVRVRRVK